MKPMARVGQMICRRREDCQLTQYKLARMLNVSIRTIRNWETGKTVPPGDKLVDICGILKIKLVDLL